MSILSPISERDKMLLRNQCLGKFWLQIAFYFNFSQLLEGQITLPEHSWRISTQLDVVRNRFLDVFFCVFLNIPTQPPTPLYHLLPFCLIKSWLLGNFSHQPPKALPKSSECEKVHTSFRAKEKGFLCTRYLVDDSFGSLSLHVAYIFINFQMKDNMMLEQWPG